MRKESRFGWNDELFPGLPASLPSFSLFLSSSLTILKFRPHPIPFLRKVASIISIIKTRCTAALCCLYPVFPDAFKPTPVVGAFSDQAFPFPPLIPVPDNCHYYPPRSRIVTVETVKLLTQTLPAMYGEHGGHDESVHANSTEPAEGFVIVGNKSRR